MKTQIITLLGVLLLTTFSCTKDNEEDETRIQADTSAESLYFPPVDSVAWEKISTRELGWNLSAQASLNQFLDSNSTKAFIILKDGKIAVEKYFDKFEQDNTWYWASAGQTLTAFTVGIAQEQGLLSLDQPSSKYLGKGWTATTAKEEILITLRNQLTMTTGFQNNPTLFSCTDPSCLKYETEAGTRWSYQNGPYTLLQSVISNAADTPFTDYFYAQLRDKIGMDGFWIPNGDNNIYYSTARSMARFGLLNLNDGKWADQIILGDVAYIADMKNTSQNFNQSYGYLWWLNGKDGYIGTSSQKVFSEELLSIAPEDLYAGLGENDQKLYVVPSEGLVVVRFGEGAGENKPGITTFDHQLWEHITALIN